ncbi:MAG: ATP-dependent 6-phosphofructokinase [Synergistaceae bacterium]|nr:ATP-dependent 6-phosphofructokinase [Synergistaceae bacterium]
MKKLAVLTSGGDAPGMNAAIRSVVRTALYNNMEAVGIMNGYQGLLNGDFIPMSKGSVGGILLHGGTILRTARCMEFMKPEGIDRGVEILRKNGMDALVVIGGDGSFHGAKGIADKGFPVAGVPATIDNDMGGTDFTIGFDTACNTALECVARLRDTASSHDRLFIVEVMGRNAGFIALQTGIACGAEYIAIPEKPLDIDHIRTKLRYARERGKTHSIIITAEGACSAQKLCDELKGKEDYDPRVVVLGHLLRGGHPTCTDASMAARLGAGAVQGLINGESGFMAGMVNGSVEFSPLERAWKEKHEISDSDMKLLSVLSI